MNFLKCCDIFHINFHCITHLIQHPKFIGNRVVTQVSKGFSGRTCRAAEEFDYLSHPFRRRR